MAYKSDLAELMKDHYNVHFRTANYLLVAHGTGLVGSLSVLRDYAAVPQLKGVGLFVLLFGIGLLFASFNYVALQLARSVSMNAVIEGREVHELTEKFLIRAHLACLAVAFVAFILGIIVIVSKFSTL